MINKVTRTGDVSQLVEYFSNLSFLILFWVSDEVLRGIFECLDFQLFINWNGGMQFGIIFFITFTTWNERSKSNTLNFRFGKLLVRTPSSCQEQDNTWAWWATLMMKANLTITNSFRKVPSTACSLFLKLYDQYTIALVLHIIMSNLYLFWKREKDSTRWSQLPNTGRPHTCH